MAQLGNSPAGWQASSLSAYFDLTRQNLFASFQNCPSGYGRLTDINDCFEVVARNMIKRSEPLAPIFFARSHSAYLSACEAALSGRSPECFALCRFILEAAGYAILIHKQPSLGVVWLSRSADKKSVRNSFTHGAVVATIRSVDKKLANIFSSQYETAIDFGAHPNEMAGTGSMSLEESGADTIYKVRYLDERPLIICHAMKAAAEAGLCSLYIFQHIFPSKFELLGVRALLPKLSKRLTIVFKPPKINFG